MSGEPPRSPFLDAVPGGHLPEYRDVYERHVRERSTESIADSLGRTPKIAVISVIEVRFLRGAGIDERDPIREVVAYFRAETGEPIVEIDTHMKDI